MIEVQVRFNNIEYALRILKKKLQEEEVFKNIKERQKYEKPSEKRKRKIIESKKKKKQEIRNIRRN